jgi:hypothetical protein
MRADQRPIDHPLGSTSLLDEPGAVVTIEKLKEGEKLVE